MPETDTIHGDIEYIEYTPTYLTFPVILAVVPLLYMIPTILITVKIFNVYLKNRFMPLDANVNPQIFLIISLSQLTCFLNFLTEYLSNRLPATGIFTSWCASVQPNHYLKMFVFFNFYFLYAVMILPSLISLQRLFCIIYPGSHPIKIDMLLRISIPFTFIYPFLCVWFLIPALGVCMQINSPFPFGSIYVYYTGAWFGLRNSYFYISNIVIWLIVAIIINAAFIVKFKQAKKQTSSVFSATNTKLSNKAEMSLSMTIIAMILPFFTNLAFQTAYMRDQDNSHLIKYLRMFGNDFETVVVPWVFYLTHPVFRRKQRQSIKTSTHITRNHKSVSFK